MSSLICSSAASEKSYIFAVAPFDGVYSVSFTSTVTSSITSDSPSADTLSAFDDAIILVQQSTPADNMETAMMITVSATSISAKVSPFSFDMFIPIFLHRFIL